MQRTLAVLAFITLAAGSVATATGPFESSETYVAAQFDFVAAQAELGLSGAAPMVGLEQTRVPESVFDTARRDFEVVAVSQGLSGSAPLVGLEKYELTVRPQVAHVILANASRGR